MNTKTRVTRTGSQLVSRSDVGSLFGTVGSLIGVILLIGLALALFNRFDGDVLSVLTWAGNGVFGFISWIADLFAGNSFFQQAVR